MANHDIDKQAFGAFVSQLRRQQGLTQKELAVRLYISDKAVSKWETGASIPDTGLLIPLAEQLGVSVTELLLCRRVEQGSTLGSDQVEDIVKTAIGSKNAPVPRGGAGRRWILVYLLCLTVGTACQILAWQMGCVLATGGVGGFLGALFGGYFLFLSPVRLPGYYDEYRVSIYADWGVRMNVPGLYFNNRNWPHLRRTLQIWGCGAAAALPALELALALAKAPDMLRLGLGMTVLFGGLFIPLYVVGKKYE